MTDVKKTILLIGRSGRGKSTLANVITNTDKFKESSSSASETKKIQLEQFKDIISESDYAIIDTPGIGDTKMSDNDVLNIIAEAVYLAKDGISQVFFATDGRFDQYEMATYDLLRTIIFDKDITKHTTIVRTRFPEFRNETEWKSDIKLMIEEANRKREELKNGVADKKGGVENLSPNDEKHQKLLAEIGKLEKELAATNLAEILESCQERVIYVDNPSLNIKDKEELELNKEDRDDSRKILLEHLSKISQEESYKPEKLAQLSNEIADDYFQYLKKKAELQKELEEEMKRLNSRARRSATPQASSSQASNINIPVSQTELITEEEKPIEFEENVIIIEKEKLEKIIAELQDKKARLKKEIQEKEKIIHQKVLKHIFNNYEAINKELGGDIFLNSVTGDHNWQEIHSEFANKELIVKWLSQGFDYFQTKEWFIALSDFDPEHDADFCAWLRDKKQLTVDIVKRASYPQNVERLRNEYAVYLGKEIEILDKHKQQLEKKDWADIHPDFIKYKSDWETDGLTYQDAQEWVSAGFISISSNDCCKVKNWKAKGFDYNRVKEWIDVGLSKDDYEFADYLKKKNYEPNNPSIQEIIQKESWKDIHSDFNYQLRKTWEEAKFTHSETQEWIQAGFKPDDYEKVKSWKTYKFTPQEAKSWMEIGLDKEKDAEFATYLRGKEYQPNPDLNLEQLRKEFEVWKKEEKPAQEYLNIYYPKNQRKEITNLDISSKNLTGSLDLSDFVNLEELNCRGNELTSLSINNCAKLKKINCYGNKLADLEVSGLEQLEEIWCYNNNFSVRDLSIFSHLVELRSLDVSNDSQEKINQNIYNHFTGSLEPLKNLTKLKILWIKDTDINSGLEYLPDSLEEFYCSADLRKDAKCQIIYNSFADEQGLVEVENGYIKNFSQKFQAYKQKPQVKTQIEENLFAEEITFEQLNQQLAKNSYLTNFANTWQKYLDTAQTPAELNIRKDKILTTIKNLKSEVVGDQQPQILQPNLPKK
jgi:hypothetical protein